MLARALTQLKNDPASFHRNLPLASSGPIYRYPKNLAMLRFWFRSMRAWVGEQFASLFLHQQWSIGIVEKSPAHIVQIAMDEGQALNDVKWLPELKGSFLADPFLLASEPSPFLIAEEYDWKRGIGHLSSVERVGTNWLVRETLTTVNHLSYPFLFVYEGKTFCLPECSASGRATLYGLGADGTLDVHGPLLTGFPAVDPTLLYHEGHWWLFCTRAGSNDNDTLYAFYARELGGDWRPHALNPIKIDVRSSRPAGAFIQAGPRLVRPAQDCSIGYGRAIVFNEVVVLSPTEYREEVCGRLVPEPAGPYRHGLHTISGDANLTVVDGARLTLIPRQTWRAMKRKLEGVRA
jgi:hypothetical protein